MSHSWKSYPTTGTEKIKHREKRLSLREWEEHQEKMLEKELRKQQNLLDYLRVKGEIE